MYLIFNFIKKYIIKILIGFLCIILVFLLLPNKYKSYIVMGLNSYIQKNNSILNKEKIDINIKGGHNDWYPFVMFYNENEGFNVEAVSAYQGRDFPAFLGSICYETVDGGESWTKSGIDKSLYLGLTCFPERDLGFGLNLSKFCTIKKK